MSEEENQMAQVQEEKGLYSGYLRFDRTPSCEAVRKHREQNSKVINKLPAKRPAAFILPLTYSFSSYPPLPWPDANHLFLGLEEG